MLEFPQDELEWALLTAEEHAQCAKAFWGLKTYESAQQFSLTELEAIDRFIRKYCVHAYANDYDGVKGWTYCTTCGTSKDF